MARRNKNNNTTDAFIAQSLIELEKPKNNRRAIILIALVIILIVGGCGAYIYFNRADFEWEFRMPWQSDEEEPIFSIKSKSKLKEEKFKQEVAIPKFVKDVIVNNPDFGFTVSAYELDHDTKGYFFKLLIEAQDRLNFSIDKILVDNFPFDVDFKLENIKGTFEGIVRIKQTDLDRYNIKAFSKMIIYYDMEDLDNGNKGSNYYVPDIMNDIKYDNTVKGLIEMYRDKEENFLLSYLKTDTDKDNTYIYFHLKNNDRKYAKEIRIKKLIINDSLYEYNDYCYEVYRYAQDIFYLTIPKKKVRDVETFTVSFFITDMKGEYHNNATYITNEFTKTA